MPNACQQQRPRKNSFQFLGQASLFKTAMALLVVTGTVTSGISSASADISDITGFAQPDPTSAAVVAPDAVGLPFTMPSKATLQASPRKVFAHYIPSLPISIDNKPTATDYYARNYLAPSGEALKHITYGGFLRDRPLGRPAVVGNWQLEDMKTEVRQAISVGIDGFAVDILQLPGSGDGRLWTNTVLLAQAAAAVDPKFKIVPTPDMNSSARSASAAQWASALSTLSKYSSIYRLGDGRMVISPFLAEAKTPAWWTSVTDLLSSEYGVSTAFVPVFLDDQKYAASFASISYGMGNWGARNPMSNNADVTYSTSPIGRANKVQSLGKIWMQPVSVQDSRPSAGLFEEPENTQNLRNTWKIAMSSGAEWVNMATWNDYSENTQFAPSQKHGWSLLDISSYYLAQYKTGSAPKITKDAVYVTHRTQTVRTPLTGPTSLLMQLRAGSPARDTVEALTFLKAPGTVRITTGSTTTTCSVDAGVDTCTVPLRAGAVRVDVQRSGATVASAVDPYQVSVQAYAQDLLYIASGSMSSNGTGLTAGAAVLPQTVNLAPVADSYANAGAPNASFGTSWSMCSRGNIGAISYLRFAIPVAPSGKTLTTAVLAVNTTTELSAGSSQPHSVSLAGDGWTETSLNWNNKPALGATLGTLSTASGVNEAYQVSLSTAGLPTGQATLAISSTGSDGLCVWTQNHGAVEYRPHLVLTYS